MMATGSNQEVITAISRGRAHLVRSLIFANLQAYTTQAPKSVAKARTPLLASNNTPTQLRAAHLLAHDKYTVISRQLFI